MADRCKRCHRALSDPFSREVAAGPECRAILGIEERHAPSLPGIGKPGPAGGPYARFAKAPRAAWTYTLAQGYVLLEDLGGGMSVTNDAERVIAELAKKCPLPAGRRVLYRGSEGRWDELLVKEGRFAGFAPVGATGNYRAAIDAAERKP